MHGKRNRQDANEAVNKRLNTYISHELLASHGRARTRTDATQNRRRTGIEQCIVTDLSLTPSLSPSAATDRDPCPAVAGFSTFAGVRCSV